MSQPKIIREDRGYRFPVDPNVKYGGRGAGAPPSGHPRRCQSTNRLGLQCGHWALRGMRHCKLHGGHPKRALKKLPNYLGRKAGPKLKERLEAMSEMSEEERKTLTDEIDFLRTQAEDAVELYSKAMLLEPNGKLSEADVVAVKCQAAEAMRNCLSSVKDFVSTQVKMDSLRKDRMPIENAAWIVYQVLRIIHEEVEPIDLKLAKRVAKRIENIGTEDVVTGTVVSIE